MKRILATVLCIALLLAALPVTGSATGVSRHEAVKQEVSRVYAKCLESAEKENFSGLCGLMASHQLWHMGVNRELGATYNGNQQFDAYKDASVTSGGYHITAYPADQFTLDQALAAITRNGTRDVSNILVGFEATNTEAGSLYGHVVVIHAIIGGTVYFVENYHTSLAGPEGSVITCSIDTFVRFYEDWTVLDGVIHFGNSRYSDNCQSFGTNLYLRTRFPSTLRSQPSLLGQNDSVRLRTLAAGELLHATAVYMNGKGELYYYIEEGAFSGYVAASAVSVYGTNDESLTAKGISVPEVVAPGKDGNIEGTAVTYDCAIGACAAVITDEKGETVQEVRLESTGSTCRLEKLNEQLDLSVLEEGEYTVSLYATASCVAVKAAGLVTLYSEQLLHQSALTVGEKASRSRAAVETASPERPEDGWFVEDGVWYYYKHGKPCRGWVTYLGVEYYLNDDGSVTTGWAEIEGFRRFFSSTGAVCTGWLTAADGVHYWLPDGTEAVGLQKIAGKLYFFSEEGVLLTKGTVEQDGVTYKIQSSGIAVPKK